MMIIEQNYTTIFCLPLNQTNANMVNQPIVRYSWDDVWNLSYCHGIKNRTRLVGPTVGRSLFQSDQLDLK